MGLSKTDREEKGLGFWAVEEIDGGGGDMLDVRGFGGQYGVVADLVDVRGDMLHADEVGVVAGGGQGVDEVLFIVV